MLALTGLAAAIPALRAGWMPTVEAISAGQAPKAGRGFIPHRLAGRLALPRPVTIGLAAPFSRPARSAVTLAALTFGLTGVVLAASLNSSIHKINHSTIQGLGQLQADHLGGRLYTLTPSQDSTLQAAVRAQPGTLHYVTDLTPVPPASGNAASSGAPASGTGSSAAAAAVPAGGGQARRLGPSVKVGVAGQPDVLVGVKAYDGERRRPPAARPGRASHRHRRGTRTRELGSHIENQHSPARLVRSTGTPSTVPRSTSGIIAWRPSPAGLAPWDQRTWSTDG
jgi:putative ABC transport system permease protein